MIYTSQIQSAIRFSIKTHEEDQKQKRKGKDVPYITHPLTVGIILALSGASEDLVVAGIIHDTIEDSIEEKKVTPEIISEKFGEKVANIVLSVTEDKNLPWRERKDLAIKQIDNFSNDSILLKSADIISNMTEILNDYEKDGEKVFERFTGKKKILYHYVNAIDALLLRWNNNPLKSDLDNLLNLSIKMGLFDDQLVKSL